MLRPEGSWRNKVAAAPSHPVMSSSSKKPGSALSGFLFGGALLGGYMALQLWILPSMGVST